MQRNVFWLVACGQKTATIAGALCISPRTVEAHKHAIEERIPGLWSFVAYGALATEIIQRCLAAGVFSETAAASSLVDASSSALRAVSAAGSPAAIASSRAVLKPLISTIAD